MSQYTFSQVDVFAAEALQGNPVAVVHGADPLTEEQLAAFARWTNLSETTFLLEPTVPEADYRLRIFTPGGELPFAGHPTLGSAHAWLRAGGVARGPVLVQECAAGLIEIRKGDGDLAFRAPALTRSGPVDVTVSTQVLAALRLDPDQVVRMAWAVNGPPWIAVQLDSADTVRSLRPDYHAMGTLAIGVIGADPEGPADYEVRAFDQHTREDPVTGSLNAAFASWLIPLGVLPRSYRVRQGTLLQRTGDVRITTEGDNTIWVGGHCISMITGTVELPAS